MKNIKCNKTAKHQRFKQTLTNYNRCDYYCDYIVSCKATPITVV